jgi:hypothetical protein
MANDYRSGLIAAGIAKVASAGGRGGTRKLFKSQRTLRRAGLIDDPACDEPSCLIFEMPESRCELLASVSAVSFVLVFLKADPREVSLIYSGSL